MTARTEGMAFLRENHFKPAGRTTELLRRMRRNLLLLVGLVLVVCFVAVALLGPALVPYSPYQQDITQARQGPSSAHWFGTDELGRDMFSRVIAGARITLKISVATLLIACVAGLGAGLVAGYFGGAADTILMRLIDVQLAIPSLVLAIVIITVLGSGLNALIFVMSIFAYPSFARLTRGVTLSVREEVFVQAAIATGVGSRRLIGRHLLPQVIPHVLALATVTLGRVVLSASSLGFLGFGIEPGTPEWGMMVAQGRSLFRTHPHVILFPSTAILLVVLGFNLLGDGLRDLLDPRLRN